MSTIVLNEIKEVPDVPQGILTAASEGKLVAFIGNGVSRVIGCPSWKELADTQVDYLFEKRCINFYECNNLKTLDARKSLSICGRLMEEKNIPPPDMVSFF